MANDLKKITRILLHEAIPCHPIPAQRTLDTKKLQGLKMSWGPEGVWWTYQGIDGLFPAAGVGNIVFAEEPEETKANKGKAK